MKPGLILPMSFPALALAIGLTGCTHMIHPPKQAFTGYTPHEKIPLKVRVNLTEELRQAKWEKRSMGDTWVIPIGQSIAQNAPVLARHAFREVTDSPSIPADAILTPKVAYINRTTGATSFGKSIVAIKIEWTLSSPDGQPIWVDTVSGEGSGSTGWTNPKDIVKLALEDVLKKSQQAISSADAIRQFAARKSSAAASVNRIVHRSSL